ncbi:hypothetical protein MNAB215_5550 [Mycobacterium numidiamassiliense]|uniref:Uncharacterized protein n=1 Tax=Mycobacterium numidiamassiliense TaxID=1841861 RepID=A0A2U3PHT2_9MYCO|nr:hypothetical protein MNAB215_5550 [Mycobacterium numidiamassiliense]
MLFSTSIPEDRPHRRRIGLGFRAVAVAATATAVTGVIALIGSISQPAVMLTAVEVAPGVSVTPAPAWTVGTQGPGWVVLHNGFSTAAMEIRAKPASGTDPVAVLQGDINNLGVTVTGLTNVKNVTAPATKPLQSAKFQQEASIDYGADGSSQSGTIPVIGSFIELLNTSTHQSAFIIFEQNGDATTQVDNSGGLMIDSML